MQGPFWLIITLFSSPQSDIEKKGHSLHIPDSVLSPVASIGIGLAMLPIWAIAGKRVKKSLGVKQVPLLALGAAFCFVVMMFNIPALGGTTAHPVAGTLLAILIGPWAACIGISVTLAIQALFFGDGGILSYGVNCFVMAFVLPFVGYSLYRLLLRFAPDRQAWRYAASAVGAYAGINAAAAVVACILGVQPALFHEANGHALYFPFGLNVTFPAMLGTHLVIAGPAEAVVTALVVRFAEQSGILLYDHQREVDSSTKQQYDKARFEPLWVGLLALVALTPLGLLAKGDAWGEWDAAAVKEQTGKIYGTNGAYIPRGLQAAEEHAYKGVKGLEDYAGNDGKNKWGYLGAGVLGVGTISGLMLLGGRLLSGKARFLKSSETRKRPRVLPPSQIQLQSALPDWITTSAPPSPPTRTKTSNQFLEKTLISLSEGAFKALNGEKWSGLPGVLQRIDPRAKTMAAFGIILAAAFIRSFPALLTLYTAILLLALVSRLSMPDLLKRVWLTTPIFVGTLALPVVLNVVTPGFELFPLWKSPHLAVTLPGTILAATLIFRVGVAVTVANLLTMTTRWNDLLFALQSLFVPRLFLMTLAMTYRYLSVLLLSANEMFVARKSRTIGRMNNHEGRQFVGTSMGSLFTKTVALSEEVHAAMVSRGYTGAARTLSQLKWKTADSLFICGTLILIIGVLRLASTV